MPVIPPSHDKRIFLPILGRPNTTTAAFWPEERPFLDYAMTWAAKNMAISLPRQCRTKTEKCRPSKNNDSGCADIHTPWSNNGGQRISPSFGNACRTNTDANTSLVPAITLHCCRYYWRATSLTSAFHDRKATRQDVHAMLPMMTKSLQTHYFSIWLADDFSALFFMIHMMLLLMRGRDFLNISHFKRHIAQFGLGFPSDAAVIYLLAQDRFFWPHYWKIRFDTSARARASTARMAYERWAYISSAPWCIHFDKFVWDICFISLLIITAHWYAWYSKRAHMHMTMIRHYLLLKRKGYEYLLLHTMRWFTWLISKIFLQIQGSVSM